MTATLPSSGVAIERDHARGPCLRNRVAETIVVNDTHGWTTSRSNGGLVVTGAPGVRKQYSCDFLISDFVLQRGFAYACTDKGNNGPDFYRDGDRPGDAVAEWHERMTQLAIAAQGTLRERFGHPPQRTYLAGISNGGYLVRWQLERMRQTHRLGTIVEVGESSGGTMGTCVAKGSPSRTSSRRRRRPAGPPSTRSILLTPRTAGLRVSRIRPRSARSWCSIPSVASTSPMATAARSRA